MRADASVTQHNMVFDTHNYTIAIDAVKVNNII